MPYIIRTSLIVVDNFETALRRPVHQKLQNYGLLREILLLIDYIKAMDSLKQYVLDVERQLDL